MSQDARTVADRSGSGIALVEVSVVLVINGNNPSILNPDFLRHNEIVDSDLQLAAPPPVSTPLLSQVVFEGGIGVIADPERFVFSHHGEMLATDTCKSPGIAKKFLERHPNMQYSAVGINPKSVARLDNRAEVDTTNMLTGNGEWISFKGARPEIRVNATYEYETRKISMDIYKSMQKNENGLESYGVVFQANIHRDIPSMGVEERADVIMSILSNWESDISDFDDLVAKIKTKGLRS